MLYAQDLEELVFNRHSLIECDELVVISGYVGPKPIEKLKDLPINSTVIYGMYGCDGVRKNLHNALIDLNNSIESVDIKYSVIPVHSKCYIWMNKGKVVNALIGSANFSVNGLTTPFREVLADATRDTFDPLQRYLEKILEKAIGCDNGEVKTLTQKIIATEHGEEQYNADVCSCPLYSTKTNDMPNSSGLNWGQSENAHVNKNDSYIPISKTMLRRYPTLFPEKQIAVRQSVEEGRRQRHNDEVEIIWDDGATMKGLLEGTQDENGKPYPNKFCSYPSKSELGKYIRNRLGVALGQKVTLGDLERYGRKTIDISLLGEGIYYFDFSKNKG